MAAGIAAAVLISRGPGSAAAHQLADQRRLPLLVASVCAFVVPSAAAAAWRSVLASPATATALTATAWARLLGCVSVGALARLLLATAVLDALSVPHPLAAAVVGIGALALGNALPLAPGAAGVPAAAMAVGLSRSGIDTGSAVAAAISFHAFETAAAIVFAAVGWLVMRGMPQPGGHPGARPAARDRDRPPAAATGPS